MKVLLVLEGVASECGADDDQRRRAPELRLLLSPGRLLQARQSARAQHAETPRVGPMVVWCPARELEQFVERLAVNRLGPEGLVGATGTNRLFDIHRLRIAFPELRGEANTEEASSAMETRTRSRHGATSASSRTDRYRESISSTFQGRSACALVAQPAAAGFHRREPLRRGHALGPLVAAPPGSAGSSRLPPPAARTAPSVGAGAGVAAASDSRMTAATSFGSSSIGT